MSAAQGPLINPASRDSVVGNTTAGPYQHFPDNFCPDSLWNSAVSWYTDNPDLTECFQETVLVWIPCGFLWLVLPLQGYNILSSGHRIKRWTWVSLTKMILCMALIVLNLVNFFYVADVWRTQGYGALPDVDLIVPLIKTATFLLAALYIFADKRRARPSSGILFVFWLLMVIEALVTFRSRISHATTHGIPQSLQFVTQMIAFPIVIVQFVLSCVAEYFPVLVCDSQNPSPEPLSSLPTRSMFSQFSALAYLGWKRPLQQSDLWDLVLQDKTKTSVERLEKFWLRELGKRNSSAPDLSTPEAARRLVKPYSPSFTKALIQSFWGPLLLCIIYRLINDVFIFAAPQILRLLIDFVSDKAQELWKGYFYAVLMLLGATVQTFALNHYFFGTSRVGLHIRAAVMAAVYRKALRITSAAKRSSNLGEIVNLMSVDAQRLNDLMSYINLLWSGPLLIGISIYFLWEVLGNSVFPGIGVLVLMIPTNAFLASRSKTIQLAQMKEKDARIKLVTEILNGMKVLKLYAWEASFEKQVLEIRELELRQLQKAARLEALSAFNWFISPFLVAFAIFAMYVLSSPENILTADKAFVALSLLNIMRHPLTLLPHTITLLVQSRVSVGRLTKFLCNDELNPNNVRVMHRSEGKLSVVLNNASFSWDRYETVCLKSVNVHVADGDLVAIVGQVGSGKSSLVAAMLGLMDKISGDVAVKGTVAYVPQQAWIQNLSLRDNILFGHKFDEDRYERVLEACALKQDLLILPAGDMTEIGEKGINLSGGQRQRVSLARAVYSDADVYFLDDPLSAVDAHVGKHIFQHVVGPEGILKNKTRILVTHGIGYLPEVDNIIVLDKGTVSEVGTYEQLLHNNGAFAEFLREYFLEEEDTPEEVDPQAAALKNEILGEIGLLQVPNVERQRTTSMSSVRSMKKVREVFRQESRLSNNKKALEAVSEKNSETAPVIEENEKGKLVQKETSKLGSVKWNVYNTYFKHATYKAAIGMVFSYAAFNALNVGGSFWLTAWTKDSEIPERKGDNWWRDYRLSIYGVLGALQAGFVLLSYLLLAYGQIMASRNLHKEMLLRIMRAPMSFFDTTPLGRIVNRFTKDVEIVDSMIPMNMESLIYCLLSVAFTLLVICISTPLFTPVIIPLGIFYYLIQRFFIASSRQLKRLEAVSRSPIYSHFQESVQGSSVILSTRQVDRFVQENERRVDVNNMSFFINILSQRWVAIRMDCAGNLVTFFAALFAVISRNQNWTISPEDVGMSISYALSVTQVMNWMVRNASDMESNVVSVERIKEYSEIQMEAPWVIESRRPDKNWPTAGHVRFNNYQTRYRNDLDLVLRGVDCDIASGEKIGIVGRTGAGKSSLTLALFRIIEAAGGSIVIDDMNIADLGLHDVRSRITILPQEPVLFSGTLRMNLDPFQRYADDEVWYALENSHLRTFVSSLPDGLSHLVAEGGENLSVGQRQLICLARALLRKTKILVLDEATAAIDLETDALIQETIREKFADCTILTIAHRLNTIMDSTRVMVLDQGLVKEFDSPENLLNDATSIFYSLAKAANLAA